MTTNTKSNKIRHPYVKKKQHKPTNQKKKIIFVT